MKILVICQYYNPEPVRISDICEELVARGNQVTVITGIPNYPMGNIYDGYKNRKKRNEKINGVKVIRCFTIPRKTNSIMRFLNYHSFSYFSKKIINKLSDDFDIVLVNQLSPIMMANAGIKYKKKFGKKVVMYCLDIWPESLLAGGIKKDSLIYKAYYKISKKIYSQMDKIIVTSKSFISYLEEYFNIDKKRIKYLPQYAESLFDRKKCNKHKNSNIDLLFAGNIGRAQSIDTIIDAAQILRKNNSIKFHIVGDGQDLERIKLKSKNMRLNNIIFYGRKKLNEMPEFYKKADAMLVTLCGNSLISSTLPGKVQTYMAAGKPIIASANGETQEVIEKSKCGFCGPADDGKKLAENIQRFLDYYNKEELGNNAFNYYKKNFDKDNFINKLIAELRNEIR